MPTGAVVPGYGEGIFVGGVLELGPQRRRPSDEEEQKCQQPIAIACNQALGAKVSEDDFHMFRRFRFRRLIRVELDLPVIP